MRRTILTLAVIAAALPGCARTIRPSVNRPEPISSSAAADDFPVLPDRPLPTKESVAAAAAFCKAPVYGFNDRMLFLGGLSGLDIHGRATRDFAREEKCLRSRLRAPDREIDFMYG